MLNRSDTESPASKLTAIHPRWSRIRIYFMLMRPQQWIKNLLVLAPLLFADQLAYPAQILRAAVFFAAFCLVSSAVYILNDVADRRNDQAHPRKRHRPIASGIVSVRAAVVIALLIFTAGLALGLRATVPAIACLLGYVLLQILYTLFLKHVVIIDIMSIAAGFVLRAVAGAYAVKVMISPWLLICTVLLALLIALGKRRSELLASNAASAQRPVLGCYSAALLDQMIAIVTSCTLLAYILYTFSEQTMRKFASHMMPLTLPFVLYGVFRYLYLIHGKSQGEEPEMLLIKDRPLLLNIFFWGIAVIVIVSVD